MKFSNKSARRPKLTTDRRAMVVLLLVLDLAAVMLVLWLVKPLGDGPRPLAASAYAASSDAARARSSDERTVAPATHLLEPVDGKRSKLTFLFHRPEPLRVTLTAGPSAGGAPVEVDLRLNGQRHGAIKLAPKQSESTDVTVVRGDRLTLARGPLSAATAAPIRVHLEGRRPHLVAPLLIAAVGALLLLVLQRRGRPSLSVLAIVTFGIVLAAETFNFGPLQWTGVASWGALVFSYYLLVDFLCAGVLRNRLLSGVASAVLALPLLVVPVIYFGYFMEFKSPVDADILSAIFQTNPVEAFEFVLYQFGLPATALVAAGVLTIAGAGFLEIGRYRPLPPTLLAELCCVLLLLQSGVAVIGLPMARHLMSHHRSYSSEIAAFERTLEARQQSGFEFTAETSGVGERYVLVIGESQTRESMGLYGYPRPTTPRLSELAAGGSLLVQREAYSSHTHTMETLSLALTAANQLTEEGFFESPSILDVAHAAGFETAWISNQAMYGPWDNMVTVLAVQADTVHSLNTSVGASTATASHDGELLPYLEDFLLPPGDDNRLAVVHLMGNHGNYCDRYPEEFSRYRGPLPVSVFGSLAGRFDGRVNCYDNSILYNDHVVREIIAVLERAGGSGAMLYFADHADDVLGGRRHASSRFTFGMTEIPVLVWLSEDYRAAHAERVRQLEQHMRALYSNDLVYDTMVGLMGIATEAYRAIWDLGSDTYRLDPSEAATLTGRRGFASPENRGYHQRANLHALARAGLGLRVLPHRVNTAGKLSQVCDDGAMGVEIDVHFDPATGTFQVGHDAESMTGGTLEELLGTSCAVDLQKIWLDVKSLSNEDAGAAAQALITLDRTVPLRRRVIVETPNPDADLSALRAAGFHTSYYLPTKTMLEAMEDGGESERVRLAATVAERVATGGFSAVSFDARAYPFVSSYLAIRLDSDVVFHTWDLPTKLWQPDLLETLKRRDVFADPRVATILLPYESPFTY